jgi:dTDP-4-amino-4,6-dideoxygalactose transaminase
MTVAFLDLRAAYLELKPAIDAAVARVLDSGYYILGPEVEAFEAEYAAYCQAAHCVGLNSGLDALVLALRALEIGPGDEVIVPSNTFIATWLAVSSVGATIVPVEPLLATSNIDPSGIAAAITDRTRAIIPVHLYGQPTEIEAIVALARPRGIAVIEDAAQAHGALSDNRRIGAHGDVVCWSFYPGKNLGALGDAGAVTTDRADLADSIRMLRNYGSKQKYQNEVMGVNSRMDPMQAAILRAKLPVLDEWTERRKTIAARYSDALRDTGLALPQVRSGADPVWHLYTVRSAARDALQARLAEMGIGTLVHYPVAPHMQSAYAQLGFDPGRFPIARKMAGELLSLPIGPHVTSDMADRVIDAVRSAASQV